MNKIEWEQMPWYLQATIILTLLGAVTLFFIFFTAFMIGVFSTV